MWELASGQIVPFSFRDLSKQYCSSTKSSFTRTAVFFTGSVSPVPTYTNDVAIRCCCLQIRCARCCFCGCAQSQQLLFTIANFQTKGLVTVLFLFDPILQTFVSSHVNDNKRFPTFVGRIVQVHAIFLHSSSVCQNGQLWCFICSHLPCTSVVDGVIMVVFFLKN